MSYKIITHSGKAHMDELLASALLSLHLGEEPVAIERIDSQDAAQMVIEGPLSEETYFIDCGMVYDSEKRLYDHHQDRELDSAALLVFNKFFPHLADTDLHKFIKLVSQVDTKGAMSLDDFDLISESRDYFNFGNKIILQTFEKDPMLMLSIVKAGMDDKIQFEIAKAQAALWLKETDHIEITRISNLNILKYLIAPPTDLVSPLRSAIGEVVDENDVSAILSFDDKQPGVLTFYRTDYGHEHVDFSKSNPHKTIFCHQGGFLMKFRPLDENEWIEIFRQSVR